MLVLLCVHTGLAPPLIITELSIMESLSQLWKNICFSFERPSPCYSLVESIPNKIEEAQKELKDPKGSQKGISESSRRNADNIKGLKRKKVVAENRLEKIPKSPVKKPLQLKTPETALHGTSSKETTPSSCCSSSNSPSHDPSASPGGNKEPQYAQPVAASLHKGSSSTDTEKLKQEETSSRPSSLEPVDGEGSSLIKVSQSKDSTSRDPSFEGDPYHSSASLDVLLQAMEPDFSTLAERKSSLQVTAIEKPSILNAQYSGDLTTMPAVNIAVQSQPSHMQTYYIDKQGIFIGIAAPIQGNVQTSIQGTPMQSSPLATPHFMPVASNPEKPSLHMSFNTGPSTITHAPVPSGSNALPQSQPPVVHTCQSLSATVPSTIQVPVTPGSNQVQMTTVINFGADQVSKDQKLKKPGKYVCEYCSRACAKPSVLLKHIRSHTGERPYPCVTCGFSFKTKSNLYKHKKSHAHAIKLGLIARSESGGGSLSQESDKALGTHSEAEDSGDSDEDGSTADLDPDSSQSSVAALSENSLQSAGTTQASHGEEDSALFESFKQTSSERAHEPKVTASLPKVVVYPVNVSPLRADSPRVTCAAPEQAASQRQREFQIANMRSSITVLSSLKEVDGTNLSLDTVSEDEDHQCKSPLLGGHAQLQRQQATDFSQQQQIKCLLSPRSLGSTDSGYFSRSESADQAMSPPSPFVKITPPVDIDIGKNTLPNVPPVVATVMHVANEQKPRATEGHMRPPLEVRALSLEERISKLISDNEAVVDNKQLDSVKPRRTSLSRRVEQHRATFDQTHAGAIPLPQILITHEQINHPPSLSNKSCLSSTHSVESDTHAVTTAKKDASKTQIVSTHKNAGERAPSLGSLHCTQKLASVTLCPQQEPTASSKRMLSPANSLDIYMEKHQKRAKDEHGVACLTDGRSVNYLNSKMSEVTRQRKLTLVRQVCTTEPVDSPIETEAPPLLQDKTNGEKDSQATDDVKPMSPDSVGLNKDTTTVIHEEAGPALNTTTGGQGTSIPANITLKPQEKAEEQRWTPAKCLIRPSSFHGGQVKLTTSVSVVNTKDSHRLSFPSLKTATTFTWCFLMKRKPLHVPQTDLKTSAYAVWTVSPNNHNPLGLPTKVLMSLFDSKQTSKKIHYTSAIKTSGKSDILSYSTKLKDVMPRVPIIQKSLSVETRSKVLPESQASNDSEKEATSKTEPRRVKIFDGGYKSNEEYIYVRGRGRGKYICEECGIRCKKPSMLRKHIRTHSDVRPYHCVHCNFSFKTKGNLTKHMKSKAHSKKCMEMGVPAGLIDDQDAEDSGDRSQVSSADRQDSDASPQHIPSKEAEVPPSNLLAQMSISSISLSLSRPPAPESHTTSDSVPMMSPVSLSKQISISGSCCSSMPLPYSPPPVAITSDSYTSDTDSVHMMSPMSPCRQMSIDYPDFDVPPSPPVPSKGSKIGQDASSAPPAVASESGFPVDRGTQTSSYGSQGLMHFRPQSLSQTYGTQTQTHLFSHLPLHSQQPSYSSYSMVPVGGIQLVPAGLAAYSTFVPIQAGPVQLTIPAVSVIHRNTSPLPAPITPPHPEGQSTQPISSVLPCFPLGQVTGLQAQTIQPLGLETLNLMGLTNTGLASTQLMSQQGLTLNATLGLQVLTANPTSHSSTGPQTHVPGLQFVNIALPALIPSLSPLSSLSPLPGLSDWQGSPGAPEEQPSRGERGCMHASQPAPLKGSSCPGATPGSRAELTQTNERQERVKSPRQQRSPAPQTRGGKESPVEGASDPAPPRPPPVTSWQKVIDDYNEVSSDDEDRLVIAT
ncbi:hypothetical protein JOQ06_015575 [Pogonophryne albipinna]|uniref:C2H2-type domain-containing protein n=1 Tax=Pogonophryne albipinna TaxID=1090488 RepID=A0AAD6AN29_9TELE|nr:hypothetical protein JOQ06_015575 [Pogonophryne albipinna]